MIQVTPKVFFLAFTLFAGTGAEGVAKVSTASVKRIPHWTTDATLRCGEVLRCPSGGIFYKPFEVVLEHERCVWTVAVPMAKSYKINIQYVGFNENEPHLTIAGLQGGNETMQQFIPLTTGEFVMNNTNTLIITFYSQLQNPDTSDATGFVLQYAGFPYGEAPDVTPSSNHLSIEPNQLYLRYPPSGSYYENNELSTIVLPPPNNVNQNYRWRNVVFKLISMESNCLDRLLVYQFDVTTLRWFLRGSICSDVDTDLISGDDIILFVFQSDVSSTYSGFHMTFTTC